MPARIVRCGSSGSYPTLDGFPRLYPPNLVNMRDMMLHCWGWFPTRLKSFGSKPVIYGRLSRLGGREQYKKNRLRLKRHPSETCKADNRGVFERGCKRESELLRLGGITRIWQCRG